MLDSSGQLKQLYAVGKNSTEHIELYSAAKRDRPETELSPANQSPWFEPAAERECDAPNFGKAQPAGELQPQQWNFPLAEQFSRHRGKHIHARTECDDRADAELDQ